MGGGIAPSPPPKGKKAQKTQNSAKCHSFPLFVECQKKAQDVNCQGGQPMLFFNSGVITGPVRDQYWGSTGPVLGPVLYQYWASTGPVLGSVLGQYWASTAPLLGPVLDQY